MSISYGGDNIQDTDGGVLRPSSSVMRNRIQNGAMVIDQRNAGASVTNTVGTIYPMDRWAVEGTQASKLTAQQNAGSVTPPAGFTNYLGITSSSAYSVGASDYFIIQQRIEGFNTADLDFGKSTAKTVTMSFWVRSSLAGTFGGVLLNNANNRSYPFSYTISSANTWEQKSVTIAGDTTGTWVGATNGVGLKVIFSLGVGSTFSETAGSWVGSLELSATGATSVVGTSGATFYITGVQLEVGSSATGFEYRQYGQELALCQRYYEVIEAAGFIFSGSVTNGNNYYYSMAYKVNKRAQPTIVLTNTDAFSFPATASSTAGTLNTTCARIVRGCNSTGSGYFADTATISAEL